MSNYSSVGNQRAMKALFDGKCTELHTEKAGIIDFSQGLPS